MSLNYVTHERTVFPANILSDPYMRTEIEQIDHKYTIYQQFTSWARSASCSSGTWNGYTYVQLPSKGASNVDLTKNISVPVDGWYRIYVQLVRAPTYGGFVRLYERDDTPDHNNQWNMIDEPHYANYPDQHWKMVDFGLTYLHAGLKNFKLNVDRPIAVGSIFIYKVNKHDSYNITDYSHKLDIQSLQFTQNSVNELNTLEMPVTLKEDYYDEDSPSRFIFDGYTNAITVWMGEKRNTAKAMFGGYITGLTDSYGSDSGNVLTIKATDRMLDFYREPLYLNLELNTGITKDSNKIFPFVQKQTIYEAIRYIGETSEEGINCSGLEAPSVFYWNFSTQEQVNSLSTVRYTKYLDKKLGNPKPCLRLGVGKYTGRATATLFDSEDVPFDANVHNIFSFNYMYSSKSKKYPTELHFEFDMYRDGEDNITTYTVAFNSKEGANNVIGTIAPVYNGKWNVGKIDLRSAFDSYAPSSAYYVTAIRIVDNVSSTQVKNRLNSAIWLDNITVYDDGQNVKYSSDQEGVYPFEYMQGLCEDAEYSMWVDYGNSRREDILVLRSNYRALDDIIAMSSNIIEIGDVEYDMYNSNVRNFARRIYHPTVDKTKKTEHIVKDKPSKKKYKKIYVKSGNKTVAKYEYDTYKKVKAKVNLSENDRIASSYLRYRRWEDYQDLTDTTKEVDAHSDATVFLNEHNEAPYGFSLTIRGTTQLNPNQYLLVESDKRRLTGVHPIKAITHNYDSTQTDKWKTQIDLGIPSRRFRNLVLNMKKNINRVDNKRKGLNYTAQQLKDLGVASPGAFLG